MNNPAASQPRLRVFAGPNGSGKSTIHELLRPEWIGVYVNADDMERQLSNSGALDLNDFGLTNKPAELEHRFREHLAHSDLLRKHRLDIAASRLVVADDAVVHLPS